MESKLNRTLYKIYVSRKAVITELVLTVLIGLFSAIFAENNSFRLLVLAICGGCIALLPIFIAFWKGFDDGRFLRLFTEKNLKIRDIAIRYSPKLFFALLLFMDISYLFQDNNKKVFVICSAVLLLLLLLNSVIFLKLNCKK